MKISAKKYAESLLEVLEGKGKKEAQKSIESLFRIMRENRDMKKAESVIEYFSKLWDEKHNISVVDVTTATEIDKTTKDQISDYVIDKMKAGKVEMNMNVDKDIIGGVIIRKEDKVYDGSLRTRLYELKNKISK